MGHFLSLLSLLLVLTLLSNGLPVNEEAKDSTNKAKNHLQQLEIFLTQRDEDRKEKETETVTSNEEDVPKKGELFEGDIVMDDDFRRVVLGQQDKRSAIASKRKMWKRGIIPYQFLDEGEHKVIPYARRQIKRAIRFFHRFTCIRFKLRTERNAWRFPDFVQFRSIRGRCSSYVGKQGGLQNVTIGKFCTRLGTCQHEMMHAMGVIHEQSRPDRNKHVHVYWDNIKPKQKHNFKTYSYDATAHLGIPYNFESVMHYPNHAFSKNDEVTLEAINDPSIRFGQRKMMTCGDAETVNRLYRCHVPFKVSLCNHHARKYGILRQDHYDEPEVHKKFRNLFEGYPIDDGDDK